jgi:leucine dehydrogenase
VPDSIEKLIRDWDGLAVVARRHEPTGSWIFIALHDATLGPPCGGTRLKHYAEPTDGLRDAMRLARGMTHKWATLKFKQGGGKAVLAVPGTLDAAARRELLLDYGRLIESLRGAFATGRDLGTTDDDMRVLSEVTSRVHGVDENKETRDPGPYTARGVVAAMRATLGAVFGSAFFGGRSVLVQGLGGVGEPLARRLAEEGATLLLSDIDEARAAGLGGELGAVSVPAAEVYDTECDVYAPCALGATLNEATIPRLRCRAVVGSANNQLGEDEDADRLHARGILYAPDFIANGGGALAFALINSGMTDEKRLGRRLDAIGAGLSQVFREAAERGESPHHVAVRRIEQTLGRG